MSDRPLTSWLQDLGFSTNESMILELLIRRKTGLTARQIQDGTRLHRTRLPLSKVYLSLKELTRVGLVESAAGSRANHRGATFRIRSLKPIMDGLDEQLGERRQGVADLERAKRYFERAFASGTWLISTLEDATRSSRDIISRARSGDCILLTSRTFDWSLSILKDVLTEKTREEHVELRVLLADPKLLEKDEIKQYEEAKSMLADLEASVQTYEPKSIRITMVCKPRGEPIEGQMLIWYPSQEQAKALEYDRRTPCVVVYTQDRRLLGDMKEMFDYQWMCSQLRGVAKKPDVAKAIRVLSENVKGFPEILNK